MPTRDMPVPMPMKDPLQAAGPEVRPRLLGNEECPHLILRIMNHPERRLRCGRCAARVESAGGHRAVAIPTRHAGVDPPADVRTPRLARVRSRHAELNRRACALSRSSPAARPEEMRALMRATARIAAAHRRAPCAGRRAGRGRRAPVPAVEHAGEHVRLPGRRITLLRPLQAPGDLRRDPAGEARACDLQAPGGTDRHRARRERVHRRPAEQRDRRARMRLACHPVHATRKLPRGAARLSTRIPL